MWFYVEVPPSATHADIAVVDVDKGKLIKPIVGSWKWAAKVKDISFQGPNLFENIYRDAIRLLFGEETLRKTYHRRIIVKLNKERREREFERNLNDLQRWRQIVEK